MGETMAVRETTLLALLTMLDDEETGDRRLRARLMDDVLATMTPMQRELMKRWHSYICPKCGGVMVTNIEGSHA